MNDLHCTYFQDGKCQMRAVCIHQDIDRDMCKLAGLLERDCLTVAGPTDYTMLGELGHRGADL